MGGGPGGDLYLVVEVEDDARFERRGHDLYADVPVPLTTAVLGGEVQVPAISGDVALKIPPGTQNGRRFRLRGKGMPELKDPNRHGDLFCAINVRLPTDLSDEERQLFERLRQIRGDS
jgi:curved DNA-binding protein